MVDQEEIVVTSAAAIIAAVSARKLLKRRRSCWMHPCHRLPWPIVHCGLWSKKAASASINTSLIYVHELSTKVAWQRLRLFVDGVKKSRDKLRLRRQCGRDFTVTLSVTLNHYLLTFLPALLLFVQFPHSDFSFRPLVIITFALRLSEGCFVGGWGLNSRVKWLTP